MYACMIQQQLHIAGQLREQCDVGSGQDLGEAFSLGVGLRLLLGLHVPHLGFLGPLREAMGLGQWRGWARLLLFECILSPVAIAVVVVVVDAYMIVQNLETIIVSMMVVAVELCY